MVLRSIRVCMHSSCKPELTEDLYRRYHTALCRFLARMLRCEDTAAEIAQDAWVRLLRYPPRRTMDDPRAYLFQVAANTARDRLARQRTREALAEAAPETARWLQPDTETVVLARERLHILAEAVNELPPRCREVFLMSLLDGLNNGAIAARLGISRNMVESLPLPPAAPGRGVVVAELDRYRLGAILLFDDAIAKKRFSGVVALDDTDRALDAIQATLPVDVVRATPWLTLLRDRD